MVMSLPSTAIQAVRHNTPYNTHTVIFDQHSPDSTAAILRLSPCLSSNLRWPFLPLRARHRAPLLYTAVEAEDEQMQQYILIIGLWFPVIPLMMVIFSSR